MKPQRITAAALTAALSGCFNESAFTPVLASFVVDPAAREGTFVPIGELVPTGSTSLLVAGDHFSPSIVLYWNGRALPTAYHNGTLVEATLEPALTEHPGTAQVTATNEDSFPSKPITAQIVQTLPNVSDLSPNQASVGAEALTLSMRGTGFLSDSQVLWNGTPLQTTFLNAGHLTAAVPASLLADAGDAFVQVSNPTCSEYPCAKGVSRVALFKVGTSTHVTLESPASDMVWDSTHGRLYAASIASIGKTSFILSINPNTGNVSLAKTTTGTTLQLSISDQDQFLYTGGPDAGPPMRYTLPGFTDATKLSNNTVTGILAAPGAPLTAALLFTSGTGVIDDTVLRANVSGLVAQNAAWGFDASTLYTTANGVVRSAVDQSGVAFPPIVLATTFPFLEGGIFYDRVTRRLYGPSGLNLDEQGNPHGSFDLPAVSGYRLCRGASDGAYGKVFFACAEDKVGLTIRSYDADTSAPIARVMLAPFDPFIGDGGFSNPTRVVRWGTNGLAITTGRTLYLYSGAFVH